MMGEKVSDETLLGFTENRVSTLKGAEQIAMAKELLTLRKEPSKQLIGALLKELFEVKDENEMLRKRVEVGEQMDWLINREIDNMDHIAEKAFRIVSKKWRESEKQDES